MEHAGGVEETGEEILIGTLSRFVPFGNETCLQGGKKHQLFAKIDTTLALRIVWRRNRCKGLVPFVLEVNAQQNRYKYAHSNVVII